MTVPDRKRRIPKTIITLDDAGKQLAAFMAGRFTYRSLSNWEVEIENGRVVVNDRVGETELVLAEGDEVVWTPLPRPEPEVDFDCSFVYEDDRLLAVNKTGNLPCHPAGIYFHHTLTAWMEGQGYLGHLANRLDRETSGLVLVARDLTTAQEMTKVFERRLIQKRYLAIVHGCVEDSFEAIGVLGNDETSVVRKKRQFISGGTDGEYSETFVEPISVHGDYSLLAVTPKTGRMHQIRATLLAYGYPIVGDKLYGLDDQFFLRFIDGELTEADRSRLILDRQALHAWQLRFPYNGRELSVAAPLAGDMLALCEKLGLDIPRSSGEWHSLKGKE